MSTLYFDGQRLAALSSGGHSHKSRPSNSNVSEHIDAPSVNCTSHSSQHTPAYASIRQHTSAYVSIRQHTSAYVSIRSERQSEHIDAPSVNSTLHTFSLYICTRGVLVTKVYSLSLSFSSSICICIRGVIFEVVEEEACSRIPHIFRHAQAFLTYCHATKPP
jgi:hypothetical protein